MTGSRAHLSMLLGLAAALGVATAGARDAAACPAFHIVALPMGGQTELATDGGLMIVQGRGGDAGPGDGRFTLEVGGAAATHEPEYLAPGLERWHLGGAAAGAQVTLTQGGTATTMTIAVVRDKLRAPAIRFARSTMTRPRTPPHPMGGPTTELTIELAKPLPAGAVALIVYGPRKGDAGLAWARVEAGQTSFSIHGGGKSCGGGPGSIFARDRLAFAWVDARGRISPRSPLRAVTLAPAARD